MTGTPTFETNHPEWELGSFKISQLDGYASCRLVELVGDYTWLVTIVDSGMHHDVHEVFLLDD
jgi:hypothetical protein